jgi:starch synthase
MRIAMMASEAVPFGKTGGLADVAGALPCEVANLGAETSLFVPHYPQHVNEEALGIAPLEPPLEFSVPIGSVSVPAKILKATRFQGAADVYLVSQPAYFDRSGIYQARKTKESYFDNAERFAFFTRAAIEAMARLELTPDVVHLHDWQTALAAVFLKDRYRERFPETRTLLTIHNLRHQGLFSPDALRLAGLSSDYYRFDMLEHWGKANFLKGGIVFADAVGTVSPTYAQEILTSEQGEGLDPALLHRRSRPRGIINGIDAAVWNPETDAAIPSRYGPGRMEGKADCKAALQREFGLPELSGTPLIGMVTRIDEQKGLDLLLGAFDVFLKRDLQLVVLGTGEKAVEEALQKAASGHAGRAGVKIAYDDAVAHRIQAGADIFLMPSQFEPCGLTQMVALKYGTVPVVRDIGGLHDTIEDVDPASRNGTGFKFQERTPDALLGAIDRALAAYGQPALWGAIVANGMRQDFSWAQSAKAYLELYAEMRSGAV